MYLRCKGNESPSKIDIVKLSPEIKVPINNKIDEKMDQDKNSEARSVTETKTGIDKDSCLQSTENETMMNLHPAGHEGKKPFKCEFCEYASAKKQDLKRHILRVHELKNHSSVNYVIMHLFLDMNLANIFLQFMKERNNSTVNFVNMHLHINI